MLENVRLLRLQSGQIIRRHSPEAWSIVGYGFAGQVPEGFALIDQAGKRQEWVDSRLVSEFYV